MNTLENECKKFLGISPYHTCNTAYHDGIFYQALCKEFGQENVEKMLDKLDKV